MATPNPPAAGAWPMPEHANAGVAPGDLSEQPAVKAWRALRPGRGDPERVDLLRGRHTKAWKRTVYRLAGAGPGGAAVIAKRCRTEVAVLERTIYEEVLPHLPAPALRYYGFVEEPGAP